jgi:hypothetical protein
MATVMTMRATWAAAFEPRTAAGTSTTAVGPTAATTIVAVVAAAIIAVAPTAPVRPLETRPRIAADARGITREIRARLGSAGARGACFAWKQNAIFQVDRLGSRLTSGRLDGFADGLFVSFWLAYGSGVQCAFVRRICFRFAERMRVKSACLDSINLFRAHILRLDFRFASVNLFVFFRLLLGVGFFLFLFFFVFCLFERGPAHEGVG